MHLNSDLISLTYVAKTNRRFLALYLTNRKKIEKNRKKKYTRSSVDDYSSNPNLYCLLNLRNSEFVWNFCFGWFVICRECLSVCFDWRGCDSFLTSMKWGVALSSWNRLIKNKKAKKEDVLEIWQLITRWDLSNFG